ncbi:hypothetical protein MLD38_015528 [Melastoma candidum]|uniref:Uncharacterized protein n=1 Tax=Melastoma candidum TaxID=119954 RepID=A0ACB9RIB3_9MYRT|nr:hypothetical protein MLD38_015528 [Melastoma candidum]
MALPIHTSRPRVPRQHAALAAAGEGFSSGTISLGGLLVCRASSFSKVWAVHEGGPNNQGTTFLEPSSIPQGFFMLGCHGQPGNEKSPGGVLVARDESAGDLLKAPLDYSPVWNSESARIKKDGDGYFWMPVPPEGYVAVGLVVTATREKPSVEKVRCVRSDFTEIGETDQWIWGSSGFNVFSTRPRDRGMGAMGVATGTLGIPNIACLKNRNPCYASFMPSLSQIDTLFRSYSPIVYFHPDEQYLPSSVDWFFTNGALLFHKGEESRPVAVDPMGSNLPQGGSNDNAYWLDLPTDPREKERVKRGDLPRSQAYLHVKPMYGATFTDIAAWLFYPFNGPAKAKVEFFNVSLGRIGEHVGDWEHVTLRISNFNGELSAVFFSQHGGGTWVKAQDLEYQNGSNKFVAYSSLHGHASYPKPGLVLQGSGKIGIRNDTVKSKTFVDTGANYSVVAADYIESGIVTPPWLNYYREWGPKVDYDINREIQMAVKVLPGKLRAVLEKVVRSLPKEVLGEEGPTGPKGKSNWDGDES